MEKPKDALRNAFLDTRSIISLPIPSQVHQSSYLKQCKIYVVPKRASLHHALCCVGQSIENNVLNKALPAASTTYSTFYAVSGV
ncbi:hypothetical protein Ocin01_04268 [Orchesella cincta]|uniref:Uncharacterized protein n=1 Tax=Orchesella cincta TaxID=48709 RepID=A0A1D2NAY9_ORCCI|nr:hypothetical protein Ocin01_04268 [Orchesella cincta]